MFPVSEDEALVPNDEHDDQGYCEEEKKELGDPLFNIFPFMLRIIVLSVYDQTDECHADNVILTNEKAQDAEDAGEPEALI